MKILFLDLFQTKSHNNLNTSFIHCLNEKHKLLLLCEKSLYKSNIENYDYSSWILSIIKNNIRLKSLFFISRYFTIWNKSFDIIFIPNFETITFVLFSLFCNKKIYVVHHLNIDELENPIKRVIFSLYKNKINHLVFDESFKKVLKDKYEVKSYIGLINHPVKLFNVNSKYDKKNKKLCVALSQSNDEKLIQKLIKYNERTNFLTKNNIELVVRSKILNYNKNNFKVYTNYLSDFEYQNLTNNCYLTILMHPKKFQFRFSGVLFDSLFNKKMVISNNFLIAKIFSKKFPNICKTAKTAEEFFFNILSFEDLTLIEKDFNLFSDEYSVSQFQKNLLKNINAS